MEEIKKTLKKYFNEIKKETDNEKSMFNKQKYILTMCEIAKTLKTIDD